MKSGGGPVEEFAEPIQQQMAELAQEAAESVPETAEALLVSQLMDRYPWMIPVLFFGTILIVVLFALYMVLLKRSEWKESLLRRWKYRRELGDGQKGDSRPPL